MRPGSLLVCLGISSYVRGKLIHVQSNGNYELFIYCLSVDRGMFMQNQCHVLRITLHSIPHGTNCIVFNPTCYELKRIVLCFANLACLLLAICGAISDWLWHVLLWTICDTICEWLFVARSNASYSID